MTTCQLSVVDEGLLQTFVCRVGEASHPGLSASTASAANISVFVEMLLVLVSQVLGSAVATRMTDVMREPGPTKLRKHAQAQTA